MFIGSIPNWWRLIFENLRVLSCTSSFSRTRQNHFHPSQFFFLGYGSKPWNALEVQEAPGLPHRSRARRNTSHRQQGATVDLTRNCKAQEHSKSTKLQYSTPPKQDRKVCIYILHHYFSGILLTLSPLKPKRCIQEGAASTFWGWKINPCAPVLLVLHAWSREYE